MRQNEAIIIILYTRDRKHFVVTEFIFPVALKCRL